MKRTIELLCLAMLSAVPVQLTGQAMPTVAIIGTGDMGNSLGPRIARLGYPVVYGSREPSRETVRELVQQTGENTSAASQRDAAARAQIVILAVQWPPMEKVAQNLGDLSGKIVVDVSYPVRRGADGYMEQSVEPSAGELIQSWNPRAKVVKVGIPSSYLVDDPMTLGTAPTVPIAANDREAKETVANLIASLGLDPWDAGPLRFSRSIEAFGSVLGPPPAGAQRGDRDEVHSQQLLAVRLGCPQGVRTHRRPWEPRAFPRAGIAKTLRFLQITVTDHLPTGVSRSRTSCAVPYAGCVKAVPEVDVVIEIPRGSFLKRGSTGHVDFVSPLPCPFNYGAVPALVGLEGDLLDVVVLGQRLHVGTRLRVPVWGAVVLRDRGMVDHKLICSAEPLDEAARSSVLRFFGIYARCKVSEPAPRPIGSLMPPVRVGSRRVTRWHAPGPEVSPAAGRP